MKKIFFSFILFGLFSISIPSITSAQVIVKIKPNTPTAAVKPGIAKNGFIWISGHWVYSKSKHKYVWKDGYHVKPRKGMRWISGHWKKVPSGFVWVEGRWKKFKRG